MPDELPAELLRAPVVLVHRDGHVLPLEPLYGGPYHVLACSRDWFRLQVGDRTDTISTSCLKPCLDLSAPPAEPRRRGRPLDLAPWSHRRHAWLCLQSLHHHQTCLCRCLRRLL
jgi:hypothetical protein